MAAASSRVGVMWDVGRHYPLTPGASKEGAPLHTGGHPCTPCEVGVQSCGESREGGVHELENGPGTTRIHLNKHRGFSVHTVANRLEQRTVRMQAVLAAEQRR